MKKETNMKCGIVMPISQTEDYPTNHWADVLQILVSAIDQTEFTPSLVSDDPAIGLIHDRIVTNLYSNEMVICDVSSKNPNVMFELGLRLAFDKPTIIIKDELTSYSFDTGIIEHLPYPSSLRFSDILDFKKKLVDSINATFEKSIEDKSYSPFLRNFGKTIIPNSMKGQEIEESEFIVESIKEIQKELLTIRNQTKVNPYTLENNYINRVSVIAMLLNHYVDDFGIIKTREQVNEFDSYVSKLTGMRSSVRELREAINYYNANSKNKIKVIVGL